jgi:phosphoribosylglycinamide formyltransferase-1
MSSKKLNVVVLISGSGSNLQAFIDRAEELNINISAVFSNRADAYGLVRAEKSDIPAIALSHQDFTSREAFDLELANQIKEYNPELVILAGFMRILSVGFIDSFADKIINIHPSLLPKYKGLHTHQRAIDADDKFHGASVHVVTAELDDGPVIIQGQIVVQKDETSDSLQQRIHIIEHQIYPQAVKWIANNDIEIKSGNIQENITLNRLVNF